MPTYILSCCRKQCCWGLPKANMPFLKFQLFLPQFAFHPFPSWTTLESFPGRASVTTWLLSIWVNTVWVARRSPRPPHCPPHCPPRRPPPCSSCPLTSRPPPVFLHLSQHRLSGLSLFFSLKISICFTYFSTLLLSRKLNPWSLSTRCCFDHVWVGCFCPKKVLPKLHNLPTLCNRLSRKNLTPKWHKIVIDQVKSVIITF